MARTVHVPYDVEQDEDGVWCAHAQLRPGVGAHGAGATVEGAVADLGIALSGLIPERPDEGFGAPQELELTVDGASCRPFVLSTDVASPRPWRKGRVRPHTRTRVSHHVTRHPDGRGTTVPVHGKANVPKGTLRGILRDTGLSVTDLEKLLS